MVSKKTYYSIIIASFLIISGCADTSQVAIEKKPYYVEAKKLLEFGQFSMVEKTAKVDGTQQITVTSQARGKVAKIIEKEGSTVDEGRVIVSLLDTIENFDIPLQRARIAEERARLNYDQSKENIEKSIRDAQLTLQKAYNDKKILEVTTAQSIERAKLDLYNARVGITGSKAQLDTQKALTDVENSLQNLKQTFVIQSNSLKSLLDTTIYQGDTILGTTPQFDFYNDRYDLYISARDSTKKDKAKVLLAGLYQIQIELDKISTATSLSNEELLQNLATFNTYYTIINQFLDQMFSVFDNSIISVDFSQAQLDGFVSIFRSLQANYQSSKSSLTQYENSGRNLFTEQSQIILKNSEIQADNAKFAYESAKTNAEDLLFKASYSIESTQSLLDNLLATKDTQLALLQNAINDARIARIDVEDKYNKLFIASPIRGTIADILVDEGQDVSVGTPIFYVVNEDKQQIEVFVGVDEITLIDKETDIYVETSNDVYEASIISISPVANSSLQYKVTIELRESIPFVGSVVTVKIPIVTNYTLIPLDVVTITQPGYGFIYIREGNTITKKFINLGKVYNQSIELIDDLPGSIEIITSPLNNYDEAIFDLVFQKD